MPGFHAKSGGNFPFDVILVFLGIMFAKALVCRFNKYQGCINYLRPYILHFEELPALRG
jgi:hypothetical protein